jgi:hypothetical protein
MLGFLEVIYEQLGWARQKPFKLSDGQHVYPEMFVGRTDEARDLATTTTYSRLFSGRKLGKSALLRYVRIMYGDKPLPSGKVLRVVYVPVVGIDSEAKIAKAILDKLRLRDAEYGVGYDPPLGDGLQVEQLVEALERFPQDRPDESLLIVLDEADLFVEQQIREYDSRREKCLSFRIRGQVTAVTDSQGLPRVRVLYSGYRATNTREGAWRGAGSETLRLGPLSPEQAAALIAGPLARLGIDAGQQALAIAHRCGFQPIVLLRFGQVLLERMDQLHPASTRLSKEVKVTAEDVVEVFKDTGVQDEIRDMVLGNFQGNDRGLAVFWAMLREFNGRSPGATLEEPEQRVLQQLAALDPHRRWLASEDDPLTVLAAQLRDFADRHLLVRHGPADQPAYALKFPYHLPVLMQRNLDSLVKEKLSQVRPAAAQDGDRGFLPSALVDSMRQLIFQPDRDATFRAVAAASQWPDAVESPESPANLADHIDPDAAAGLVDATAPGLHEAMKRKVLMAHNVTPLTAGRILAARPAGTPPPLLLGGASLLRWALKQSRAGELVEAAGVGRLTPAKMRWWFQQVRDLHFDTPDALPELERLTGGMPLLLEVMDRLLTTHHETGGSVSTSELRRVLQDFDAEAAAAVRRLAGNEETYALLPREVELLRMATTVSRENGYQVSDMAAALVTDWEYYQELCPVPALSPTGDDLIALEVVQSLGLLPVRKGARPLERLEVVGPDDPLWRILASLRGQR